MTKEQIWNKWNNTKGNLDTVVLAAMEEYSQFSIKNFFDWYNTTSIGAKHKNELISDEGLISEYLKQ